MSYGSPRTRSRPSEPTHPRTPLGGGTGSARRQLQDSARSARASDDARAGGFAGGSTPTRPKGGRVGGKRAPRESWCSLCSGSGGFDDGKGRLEWGEVLPGLEMTTVKGRKKGRGEMVSCWECGQSGHFSCLELQNPDIIEQVKGYPWLCMDCRRCSECDRKGDDSDLLFCDLCDRGWHGKCLRPPLRKVPDGDWICPHDHATAKTVAPVPTSSLLPPLTNAPPPPVRRSSGLAGAGAAGASATALSRSSSRAGKGTREGWDEDAFVQQARKRSKGKARARDSDEEEEDEEEIRLARRQSKGRKSGPQPKRGQKRRRESDSDEEEDEDEADYDDDDDDDDDEVFVGSRKSLTVRLKVNNTVGGSATASKKNAFRATGKRPSTGKGHPRWADSDDDEEEDDEARRRDPYGGILKPEDADVGDRAVGTDDVARFERSKLAAQARLEALANDPSLAQAVDARTPLSHPTTIGVPPSLSTSRSAGSLSLTNLASLPKAVRELRAMDGSIQLSESRTRGTASTPTTVAPPGAVGGASTPTTTGKSRPMTPQSGRSTPESEQTSMSGVRCIRFGDYEIDNWYQAPYPQEYSLVPNGRLWLCEFCLKFFRTGFQAGRHELKCKTRHPPGDEIYRDGPVSVFEVDGRKNKIYCQNLCLLAKMFLDHKTLYYDVDPFLFYVMTVAEPALNGSQAGARFVGYFSKEKRSPTNNVSCIMTLPVRQRQGWGNLLIDFSYLLSKKEKRVGTPEKPLSDLGLLSYRSYWTLAVNQYLTTRSPDQKLTIEEIANATSITPDEVYYTLRHQHLIRPTSSTSPKKAVYKANTGRSRGIGGKRQVDEEAEVPVIPKRYSIEWNPASVQSAVDRWNRKGYLTLKPDMLKWSPFLTTRAHGLAIDVAAISIPLVPVSDPYAPEPVTPSAEDSGAATPIALGEPGSFRNGDTLGLFDEDLAPSPPTINLDTGESAGAKSTDDAEVDAGRLGVVPGSSATTSPLGSSVASPTFENGNPFANGHSSHSRRTTRGGAAAAAGTEDASSSKKRRPSRDAAAASSTPLTRTRSSPSGKQKTSPMRSSRRIQELGKSSDDEEPARVNGVNGSDVEMEDAEGEEDEDAEGEDEDDEVHGMTY